MKNEFHNPAYSQIKNDITAQLNKMRLEYADTSINIPSKVISIQNKALNMSYELANKCSDKYQGKGMYPLTDGKIENKASASIGLSENWVGFQKENLELTLPINSQLNAKEIEIRFLDLADSWIFQPESVDFYFVNEQNETKSLGIPTISKEKRLIGGEIIRYTVALTHKGIRKIIIKATNRGVCPAEHPGEGNPAWIFSDEIIIR
jgi:hexosaminidase